MLQMLRLSLAPSKQERLPEARLSLEIDRLKRDCWKSKSVVSVQILLRPLFCDAQTTPVAPIPS